MNDINVKKSVKIDKTSFIQYSIDFVFFHGVNTINFDATIWRSIV